MIQFFTESLQGLCQSARLVFAVSRSAYQTACSNASSFGTDKKRPGRVSCRKFLFGEDFSMAKPLLSIFVSCFLVGHLSAQVPQNTVADDYNSIFKTIKWRSIGPFRGGRSNA